MNVADNCLVAMIAALEALEPAARRLLAEAELGGPLFAHRWQQAIAHAALVVCALELYRAGGAA